MNTKYHCHTQIYNKKMNKTVTCKNGFSFIIGEYKYCYNHARINFNNYILKIQKTYNGYRTRNKLNNLFYNLPRDLQCKILYYINEPVYYVQYLNKLNVILTSKIYPIYHNVYSNVGDPNTISITIDYLCYIYYLYEKYLYAINVNYTKYMYIYSNKLLEFSYMLIELLLTDSIDNNIITISQNLNINIDYANVDTIYELIRCINKFNRKYSSIVH